MFRAILSLADAIGPTMPLGTSAFLKGGSLDAAPNHVLSLAGGAYIASRWVYFGMLLNWTDSEAGAVAEVQEQVIEAASRIFLLVHDRLLS